MDFLWTFILATELRSISQNGNDAKPHLRRRSSRLNEVSSLRSCHSVWTHSTR